MNKIRRPSPEQWSAIFNVSKSVGLKKALAYYGFTESAIYSGKTKNASLDNWKKRQLLIEFPE